DFLPDADVEDAVRRRDVFLSHSIFRRPRNWVFAKGASHVEIDSLNLFVAEHAVIPQATATAARRQNRDAIRCLNRLWSRPRQRAGAIDAAQNRNAVEGVG